MADVSRNVSVLIVALSLDRGGTEQHLIEAMPRLKQKGLNISVYCLATKGVRGSELAARGVEVIGPPIGGSSWFKGPTAPIRIAVSAVKLAWIMIRDRPQIVHFYLPAPYLVGAPIAILTARPIRIMSRRNLAKYLEGRKLITTIERLLHKHMTAVLGNSGEICRELAAEGCEPRRIGLIYNGVDTTLYGGTWKRDATRRELGLASSSLVGLLVANLIPYKGHADLIAAMAAARARMPADWVILCAGRDDGIGEALERMADEKGLSAHFRFLGSRDDVPRLLEAADFGILCSHEEGFSNAILECMAAGLSMVVTDVGGNPEAVVNGETGFVVPARDPQALGDAIATLASDGEMRRQFGRAGRRRIEERFSIESSVEAQAKLYEALLAGASAQSVAPAPLQNDSARMT